MRETARKLVAAHLAGKWKTVGNSSVEINPDRSVVYRLHGNAIVDVDPQGAVSVSLAGWPTPTTRSRVNDILEGLKVPARVGQSKGVQYLSQPWRGSVDIDANTWYPVGALTPAAARKTLGI